MQERVRNQFLRSLPEKLSAELVRAATYVTLPLNTQLFHAGERPRYVHLMEDGIASIVTPYQEGGSIEAGIVGLESFPEKLYLLGPICCDSECFIQVPGAALRVPFTTFQSKFMHLPEVAGLLMRHAQAEWFTLLQYSGCNTLHRIEKRLARWLLTIANRLGDSFNLTQEALGYMLGCRRTSFAIAARDLQSSGAIAYSRGHIRIKDRRLLFQSACECYEVANRYRLSLK